MTAAREKWVGMARAWVSRALSHDYGQMQGEMERVLGDIVFSYETLPVDKLRQLYWAAVNVCSDGHYHKEEEINA